MCVCTMCEGSFSTGGSQGLVYRRLEAANVLHGGTVCLHGLHVLVEDGKDLVVEDLVLPNAVGHLLQGLSRKTNEEKVYFNRMTAEKTGHILSECLFVRVSECSGCCVPTTFLMISSLPSCLWTLSRW